MQEEWRVVSAFPDYEVSSFGRVRRRKASSRWQRVGRDLATQRDKDGYLYVMLTVGVRQQLRRRVHRLVLDAFVGPRPEGMVCAHADCDRTNNRLDNLRWTTQRDNLQDSIDKGRNPRGSKHGCAKIDEETAYEMRAAFTGARGEQAAIARRFGVSLGIVNRVVRGKAWRHVHAARN